MSIDPANEDYDLLPLKQYIGNSRIVLLGEQSQGDGLAISSKIRRSKFLHEKMGFEVLSFENGIFDSRLAWDRILAGRLDIRNFFWGIRKGARLNADIEGGHKSTLLVQLGSIAQRTGRTVNTDPTDGHILNDKEAKKYWRRDYEPGWEPTV